MLIDNKGPRPPILIGALCLLTGYYPVHLGMFPRGDAAVPALTECQRW